MQGPSGFLNVLTIPVGATEYQERIVIDGVNGAVLVYANGLVVDYNIKIVQTAVIPASLTGSFANPTTAGNTVIAIPLALGPQATVPAVTAVTLGGSADNFVPQESKTTGTASNWFIAAAWTDSNCQGGQKTVAVTGTNGIEAPTSNYGLILLEVSGLVLSSAFDVGANNSGTGTALTSGTTATTTVPGELWISAFISSSNITTAPVAPWIPLAPATGAVSVAAYQVVSAEATASATAATTVSNPWAGFVFTLKGLFNAQTLPGALVASLSSRTFTDQFGNQVLADGAAGYAPTTATLVLGNGVSFYIGTPSNWGGALATIESGIVSSQAIVDVVAPGGLYVNGTKVTVP
jgi:hypothetical protein